MSSATLTAGLPAALVVCALGLAWRASRWLRTDIGTDVRSANGLSRVVAIARELASTLLDGRTLHVLGAFVLDALLLRRLFAREPLRAIAHHFVVVGLAWLLVVHALAPLIASRLFPGYQATLEPWLLLRDMFGAMALSGLLVLVIARRRARHVGSAEPSARETTCVALLVVVLISGFLLEAQKMASPAVFERMVDQYAPQAEADGRALLRAWWAREFGVPSVPAPAKLDAASVAQARTLHEDACASCHARPAAAFVAWPLARLFAPLAPTLDAAGAGAALLHLHAVACVVALASLPFTALFHAVASPLALLLDAFARSATTLGRAPSTAYRAVWRAVALDACVHCGICDATCSVAPISRWVANASLLPSRKLEALARVAWRPTPFDSASHVIRRDMLRTSDGVFLCTDCARCTRACPVGLDLADLWQAQRRELAAAGIGRPDQWIAARTPTGWAQALRAQAVPGPASPTRRWDRSATFARCIECQACTNVCPVIAYGAGKRVDVTPQRVMNLLRLGCIDLALGARMVHACAACYQCQQHCPEGIPVADILLELRATAFETLGGVREREAPS